MPTLNTVNVTAKPTIVFGGKGSQSSSVQLINQDTTNTVYVAYASNDESFHLVNQIED